MSTTGHIIDGRRWLRDVDERPANADLAQRIGPLCHRPSSLLRLQRSDLVRALPTQWLIPGLLALETLAGLVGPSGACKTFLAIDWACCVASGTPWAGRPVSQAPVCFLVGEGKAGIRRRIAAWEIANGVSMVSKPLYLGDLPRLCDPGSVAASIEEMLDATTSGPSLIVLDTVARAMGGANENSAEDMGALIDAMDQMRVWCNATVLSIHHTGHDTGNGHRARGSSAYRAAMDTELLVRTVHDEVVLSATKCKDWDAPGPINLAKRVIQIETIEGEECSLVLEATQVQKPRRDTLAAREMKARGMTLRAIAHELRVSKSTVERWVNQNVL